MDYLNSFFQNIKDKLTNPFFGTLTFILIVHHWQFWYTLFTFDKNVNRVQKTKVLQKLINREFTWENLVCDITWAIIITVGGYLIVVATRALSIWIEFSLMPWLTRKIINKNVVLKTTYDEIVTERDEYSEKYEEQRKNVRILSRDFDAQTEENKNKDKILVENAAQINSLSKDLSGCMDRAQKLNSDLQQSKNDKKDAEQKVQDLQIQLEDYVSQLKLYKEIVLHSEDENDWNDPYRFPVIVRRKVMQIKTDEKWQMFLAVAKFLEEGGSISGDAIQEMINYGVVSETKSGRDRLLPLGEIMWKYREVFKTWDW